MTNPYRPMPAPPPPKSDWKVGDWVCVQWRPTTKTLLGALEREHGTVMEVVDLETDQCVRVRFPVETWNRLPEAAQKILKKLSDAWPYCKLKTIGTETWMFGGDLA